MPLIDAADCQDIWSLGCTVIEMITAEVGLVDCADHLILCSLNAIYRYLLVLSRKRGKDP